VQGLEAMRRGDIGVRSLQDWALLLRESGGRALRDSGVPESSL